MLKRNPGLMLCLTAAVVLIFAFGVATVFAGETDASENAKKKTTASPKSSLSAMTVGKDPGENQVSAPSAEQVKALREKAEKKIKEYPIQKAKKHPNGATSLVIVPRSFQFNIATVGPDGKLVYNGQKPPKAEVAKKTEDCGTETQPEE